MKDYERKANKLSKKTALLFWGSFTVVILFWIVIIYQRGSFEVFSFKTIIGIIAILIMAVMIGLIITVMFTGKDNQDLDEQFLNEFVLPHYKKHFDNIKIYPDNSLNNHMMNSRLLRDGDSMLTSEIIQGEYLHIKFIRSTLNLSDSKNDSEGNTHYESLFTGNFYIIEGIKTNLSDVYILSKKFPSKKIEDGIIYKSDFLNVQTDNALFHKNYSIYTKNKLDHNDFLSTQLIEFISTLNLKNGFGMSFSEDIIMIAYGDHADSLTRSRKINKEVYDKLDRDIDFIKHIIDLLKSSKL